MTAKIKSGVLGRALLTSATAFLLCYQGTAEAYPNRPVTLVITVPPGGSIDVMGRVLASELSKSLGQPVIAENKPGAGGNIAAEFVAKAPADGHTLMITSSSTLTINPHVYARVPFDPEKSFAPVVTTAGQNMVLVVHPKHNASSVADFLVLLKGRAGKLSFGSSGPGALSHLAGELLLLRTGTAATHVPYKGLPAAMNDLLGGQLDFMFDSANAVPNIRSGKLRALAVIGPQRLAPLPEVATFKELGIHGMEVAHGWYGVFTTAGTPRPVVERLNSELVRILNMPEAKAKLISIGLEPTNSTAEGLAETLKQDLKQFGELIRQLKLNLNP
jgi:tripartite-type tricarboxylate transporter receptor subunit TctC